MTDKTPRAKKRPVRLLQPEPTTYVVKLVVKKPFDYGAIHYKPGDFFEPTGAKTDARIIEHLCVSIKEPLT